MMSLPEFNAGASFSNLPRNSIVVRLQTGGLGAI
jgi:hypothetical protein